MEHDRGKLHLHVWSMFTVAGDADEKGKLKVRWEGNRNKPGEPTADNTIAGATVTVLEEKNVPAKVTDESGHVTLNLSALGDGMYTLRLRPPMGYETDVPAGVALDPPGMLSRMYRVLDVRFYWVNGRLGHEPPPVALVEAPPLRHGAVISRDGHSLTLDWKPDFVRAKHITERGASVAKKEEKPQKRNPSRPVRKEAPPEFPVRCVVLHRTGHSSIGTTLNEFLTGNTNAHYVIDTDGFMVKMVHERDEASHAGTGAQWATITPLNAYSVGIEMVNKTGPMTDAQMKSLIHLLKALMQKYKIRRPNIVGHCEVSPLQKHENGAITNNRLECPGKDFDWQRLEKEWVAARLYNPTVGGMDSLLGWYPYFIAEPQPLRAGDNDKEQRYGGSIYKEARYSKTIRSAQLVLRFLGYEAPVDTFTAQKSPVALPVWGKYDAAMGRVVERFKARYLAKRDDEPNKPKVDTTLDKVTAYTMRRVMYGRGK